MTSNDPPGESAESGPATRATTPAPPSAAAVADGNTLRSTRTSAFWVALVVGLVVLVLLIVFILENGQHARVSYFGAHADLPLGVALLLGAVIGGLVVALAGVARILQLRARARRARREIGTSSGGVHRSVTGQDVPQHGGP